MLRFYSSFLSPWLPPQHSLNVEAESTPRELWEKSPWILLQTSPTPPHGRRSQPRASPLQPSLSASPPTSSSIDPGGPQVVLPSPARLSIQAAERWDRQTAKKPPTRHQSTVTLIWQNAEYTRQQCFPFLLCAHGHRWPNGFRTSDYPRSLLINWFLGISLKSIPNLQALTDG